MIHFLLANVGFCKEASEFRLHNIIVAQLVLIELNWIRIHVSLLNKLASAMDHTQYFSKKAIDHIYNH